MPCWNTELRLVLQMMTSAHCTTTILTKKAVWQVNSTILRCSYVCTEREREEETETEYMAFEFLGGGFSFKDYCY